MSAMVSGYAGVVGVICAVAAFSSHKFPKFQTEAFKAKPLDQQRSAIRTVRILFGIGAAVSLGFAFALGFVEGYLGAKSGQNAMGELFEQVQRDRSSADAALVKVEESMSLNDALAPERLVTAQGIADARRRLADWADALKRWEANNDELVLQTEARIRQLDAPESQREEVLTGFRRSLDNTRPLTAEIFRAKRDIMTAAGQMLDLMQARLGKVTVKNGELIFANAADAQRSNAIGQRLEAAAAREEAAAKKLSERAQATQDKARKAFGN